jgi:hypothetical protein
MLRFGSSQNFRDQSVVQATLMFDLHGAPPAAPDRKIPKRRIAPIKP